MLIFHFGSEQQLWIEIVRGTEQRQRERLCELVPDPAQPTRPPLWTWWKHISDPSLWPSERLFFELYGQALHGRAHAGRVSRRDHRGLGRAGRPGEHRPGVPDPRARAHARLGVAVTRGPHLDLLATGDTHGVDQAMRAFIDLTEAVIGKGANG